MNKYAEIILILRQYMLNIFEFHYPKEIINLIVMLFYKCRKLKISCGCNYTILIKDQYNIYTWGDNRLGQLGLGHTRQMNTPQKIIIENKNIFDNIKKIKCGENHTMLLTKHGKMYACGDYTYTNRSHPTYQQIIGTNKIKKINCGSDQTMMVTIQNEIYAWGKNYCGQLGMGDYRQRQHPEKINLVGVKSVYCGD